MADARDHTLAGLPWFLRTIPQRRDRNLIRTRLTDLLEHAIETYPLTVVSAPLGYGKTIAVADWARGRPHTSWAAAVDSIDSQVLVDALGAVLSPPFDSTHRRCVVIDDAHLIDPVLLHHSVASEPLLASGMVRVVLVGQPSLMEHFVRARSRGLATVLGREDLALTEEEADQVWHVAMPSSTSMPDDVRRATAGWPIAAQLYALRPTALASDAPQDHHHTEPLIEYIDEVLIPSMRPELADFVLAAVTCTRLDVDLARAITGREDAGALLEECRRGGYFLDAYRDDHGHAVYQWHETFAKHCREVMAQRSPDRVVACHKAAAQALAPLFPTEAAPHALAAHDFALATEIVRKGWLGMLLGGHTRTLESLCLRLPDVWRGSADVLAIRACCRDLLGDAAGAELLRRRAQAQQPEGEPSFIAVFSSVLLAADPASKAVATDLAHARLGEPDGDEDYPHGLFLLGWSELRLRRDPVRAVALLEAAYAEASSQGLEQLALHAMLNGVFAKTYAGFFTQAEAALSTLPADRLADPSDWNRYDGGLTGLTAAYRSFWQGDMEASMRQSGEVVAVGGSETSFVGLARVYHALAATAMDDHARLGDVREMLSVVSDMDKHGVPWPAYKRLAYARIVAMQGDATRAKSIADPLLNQSGIPVTHALLAELYRTLGRPSSAHVALQKIQPRECPPYARALAYTTLAALEFASKHTEAAHRHLARALDLTEHEGVRYPLMGKDPVFRALLEEHAHAGSPHEATLAELLTRHTPRTKALLTSREHEILGYLRTRMTAQEIAEALHLSAATVRTHTQAIYRKLDVTSRREAVRLAARLG